MRIAFRATGAAALGALFLAAGCRRVEMAHGDSSMQMVETAEVERQSTPGVVEVDGIVIGRTEAVLSSRLSDSVAEVSAVPGREVKAGTVMVRLESREAEAGLAGARAELAAARSALDLAAVNRRRFENLEQRGAAATVELERARQAHAAAAASVASAEAAVGRAEIDRAQAVLVAPFDAVVVEKMVSPGDLAGPGRPLVRLASVKGRRVEAAPGEAEAAVLSPGQRVDVVLGDRVVDGTLAEIVGAVDPATRRRTIRVDLPPGVEPPVGAFARLRLVGPAAPRLLVPVRGIVERGGLQIAWIVGSDGSVSLRYVRTGSFADNARVEVRSGLEAGERVVLDPPATLEAGIRVRS